MKALYKRVSEYEMIAAVNAVTYPNGNVIIVPDHIHKPEGEEIQDGWFVFYSEEKAREFFNIKIIELDEEA